MPVDQELLDSIQFLSDPLWQGTPMPGGPSFPLPFRPPVPFRCVYRHHGSGLTPLSDLGFSWVNQLNPASSSALHTNDYALYEPMQYTTTC